MEILKASEIPAGNYTITSYESRINKHGKYYLITAHKEDNEEEIKFWSNGYLDQYIIEIAPTKKFKINVNEKQITIENYSRKVILS